MKEIEQPILASVTDEGEVMITMPSGRIKFMGFWEAIKFAYQAMLSGRKIKVEE